MMQQNHSSDNERQQHRPANRETLATPGFWTPQPHDRSARTSKLPFGFTPSHAVAQGSEFIVVPQTSKPMLCAAIQRIPMTDIINLNTASAKELTQLPGVEKTSPTIS
jgi:hypothetical protein